MVDQFVFFGFNLEHQSLNDYPVSYPITTRWADNDVYGHVNNVVYYSWFDTVINTFLIQEGQLDIVKAKVFVHYYLCQRYPQVIGVCAESGCKYKKSVSYPDKIIGALRVARLGTSSVRYEGTPRWSNF